MNDKQFKEKAEQASKIMVNVCRLLDKAYESHIKASS